MKKIIPACLMAVLAACPPARAEWTDVSRGLPDNDIAAVAVDAKNAAVMYAASGSQVFKTQDSGASWQRILSTRGGDNRVHVIYVDGQDSQRVFVGSETGLYISEDGGRRWKPAIKGLGRIYCLASQSHSHYRLWVGAAEGLYALDTRNLDSQKLPSLPNAAVLSIYDSPESLTVATASGILKSKDHGQSWESVFVNALVVSAQTPEQDESAAQFDIEEFDTTPFFSNIAYLGSAGKFYAATRKGVLESAAGQESWSLIKGQSLADAKINQVAVSPATFYAATDKGVYRWDPESGRYVAFGEGLESLETRALAYHARGDYLLAATKNGLYRFTHPELKFASHAGEKGILDPAEILRSFQSEPDIRDIQAAAIHYAEVHPSKIADWRRAAARRAVLPAISINTGFDQNENVDLDRGGTGDPDHFIIGPPEKKFDWSVGLSWNLGDLIWNDDQTAIDTRSKLMAELRDEILTQVTHLYYERRRLQSEIALSTRQEPAVELEKLLKLEELTARIDAMTGQYLSDRIRQNAAEQS